MIVMRRFCEPDCTSGPCVVIEPWVGGFDLKPQSMDEAFTRWEDPHPLMWWVWKFGGSDRTKDPRWPFVVAHAEAVIRALDA